MVKNRYTFVRGMQSAVFALVAFWLPTHPALASPRTDGAITTPALRAPRATTANVLMVNSVDDTSDGTCDIANCTLREAMSLAQPGDTIQFSSLFSTPQTIVL